jgi:adenosylcobalamin-dependent ribonucleoside-triphosphate reductase
MAREYFAGMGQAVADRTINRNGEGWGDVAKRVAEGNCAITGEDSETLRRHIANASILMSGRHLQHGDLTQPTRNLELFSNCSTGCQRSVNFYLLLNGSGVGTSYDDALCIVDFRMMPKVFCTHENFHGYPTTQEILDWAGDQHIMIRRIGDSREGWAEAVEHIEVAAFKGQRESVLILDFSDVRPAGSPIAGMQDRPASGPGPLMDAITKVSNVRNQLNWKPWRQAMEIDHHLAECVLVGGARRAARIAVKYWRDPDILEFIRVKQDGGLWSANNSVGVDAEFYQSDIVDLCLEAQYTHGTGEPGFLNLDKLQEGESEPSYAQAMDLNGKYKLSSDGLDLRAALYDASKKMDYQVIVNPCGEIRLHVLGSYCVIADVVPYFTDSDDEAEEAFAEATRAVLRTNMLPALYQGEVDRTNRIGVGFTGIHEYAWKRFGYTFLDLIDEAKSLPFWLMMRRFGYAVEEAAEDFCIEHELTFPATLRTVKPAGTTSKLFGLTEGCHLPPMREYLRWVQFRSDDPLIAKYQAEGYPTRVLVTYGGTTIVGFPTQPLICTLGMPIITASEATPEQQFQWVKLIEKYWLGEFGGNQVSYTLKYDPITVSRPDFDLVMRANMPQVRAISVMPFQDMTAYEYQPEEAISAADYAALVRSTMAEDVDQVHVDCASGACPISFFKEEAA